MDSRAISAPVVFGLLIIAVAAAFYIPVVVDDVSGTRTLAINQTEDAEIVVYHELNATISNINTGQDNVSVTLEDTNTRNTTTATLGEATPQTLELENEDITVNATIINGGTVEMEYTYPVDYNWPTAMKTVADNLGIIVMGLVAFVLLGWVWARTG